jgi:ATP-binding cassette subfamily C protein CydC
MDASPPENPWILHEISFSLPPGKRLALVGPSGGGKSTLVSLLLRFWEFESGLILLDGRDLHDYSQQLVRSQFSVLLQNPYLFSASLLENLLLGSLVNPRATQEQVECAVKAASLSEFIQGLPQGYQTWVGEQGVRLSAGERQRVAIARLLLNNAPILVLDEPTAHLDALTESAIMASLLENSRDRSLLLVTHRLVGMQAMDEILVLSAGRVVERGSHSELIHTGGLYRRMWDLQRQQLPG